MHVFIVTDYGCNSTPNDMWIPHSKLFMDYAEAYKYFVGLSPSIDDDDDTEQYINGSYDPKSTDQEYVIIEDRHQSTRVKRPSGVVIARCGL